MASEQDESQDTSYSLVMRRGESAAEPRRSVDHLREAQLLMRELLELRVALPASLRHRLEGWCERTHQVDRTEPPLAVGGH